MIEQARENCEQNMLGKFAIYGYHHNNYYYTRNYRYYITGKLKKFLHEDIWP